MKIYKIAVIPGDGIGPEVITEGIKVLDVINNLQKKIRFEYTHFPWGSDYYLEKGEMMPKNGLDILREFDAVYLGAVGEPRVPDHVTLWGLLLKIRKGFDQYVNLRPVKLLPGVPTVLTGKKENDIDMLIIRENSEGEYAGAGEWLYPNTDRELVLQTGIFSRKGTERIIRYAFEEARRQKKKLTSISKGNVLEYSMVFWDRIFEEVKQEYPEVETQTLLVDAACMLAVTKPENFQIVVTSNLFGDIFSDLAAGISGGMGMAAGANINPEQIYPSMFEPVHGSAPDIAGQGKANPIAAIFSVAQMLHHFGEYNWESMVMKSVAAVTRRKDKSTPDMGGNASTSEIGDEITQEIKRLAQEEMMRETAR